MLSEDNVRPSGTSDAIVAAVAKASEAFEYVERVRGHLFSLHQLMGRADFLFEDAADELLAAGATPWAARFKREIVGRNVLDGRWTFQVVDEFDRVYYRPVLEAFLALEEALLEGRHHVYESELKEERRTRSLAGHDARPSESPDAGSSTSRSTA